MAEEDDSEKTEEPSQKKLAEARRKGDAPKSQEVSLFISLVGGLGVILVFGASASQYLAQELSGYFAHAHHIPTDPAGVTRLGADLARVTLIALAAPFAVLLLIAIAGHWGQTGLIASGEKLKPDLSKLSPIKGLTRVFGKAALANFLRGLAKLGLVAVAGFAALWPLRDRLVGLVWAHPGALLPEALQAVLIFSAAALGVYFIVAVIDFVAQRHSWMAKQRMSRRELKDEHKQSEGDPVVRARLRHIRQERARSRMMAAVPDATVIVTNPTHYAVALKWDKEVGGAPLCVAKGVDLLALRIRDVAEEHNVPLVENPPLARALYANVDVDRPVPQEYWKAVAEIIRYVFKLGNRRSRSRQNRR